MRDPKIESADRVQHETAVEADIIPLPETSSVYHAPVIQPGATGPEVYEPRSEDGE